MDKRSLIQRCIFYIVVLLLLGFCVYFFLMFKTKFYSIETFSDGPVWTVTLPNGNSYEHVDLKKTRIQYALKEGERLQLETTLENRYSGELTALAFTRQSALVGYINDREIYHYRQDDLDRFVGNGYQFVSIPVTGTERHLRMEVIGCRGRATNSIPNITLIRSRECYSYFLGEHLIMMFCAVFLLLLGLLITCISLIYFPIDYEYYPLLVIGLFGILSGIWCTSNVKTLELLSVNIGLNSFLEYLSLYFMPAPVLQLVRYQHEKEKHSTLALNIATAITVVFAFTAMVLHSLGRIIISDALPLFHLFACGYLAVIFFTRAKRLKEMETYEYFYCVAYVLGLIGSLSYIVRYQIANLFGIGTASVDFSYLPLVVLVFMMLLILGYLGFMRTRVINQTEKAILEQQAYEDRMTGLYNRTKGEVFFQQLNDRRTGEPFAIVNFDLNGLKQTNDTMGHYTGDHLLTRFAELLEENFGRIGTPIRMSGDEFIVVVRGLENIERINEALRNLKEAEESVSATKDYVMDAAYGVAKSMEFLAPDAESVYRMADQRMYEMKVASQKGRE